MGWDDACWGDTRRPHCLIQLQGSAFLCEFRPSERVCIEFGYFLSVS